MLPAYYPRSFLKLLLLAFFAAALPLVAALVQASFQVDSLAKQSQRAVGQTARIDTRTGVVPGTVVRIDPAVVSGSVLVEVDFTAALPASARPDLSVDGSVEIERLDDVLYMDRPANAQAGGTGILFRLDPGKCPRSIDQRHHRQSEPAGQFHQPDCLAVALWLAHPEVVPQPALRVVALFMANHHHPAPLAVGAQPGESANDRLIFAEIAIASQRDEIGEGVGNVIDKMWPHRVPGDLRLLPGSQGRIGAGEQVCALALKPPNLLRKIDIAARSSRAQFGNPRLKRCHRFLELKIGNHPIALALVAPAGKRMARIDQRHQPRGVNVSVDLGGGDIGVTQQGLEHPQICAAFQ